MARRVEKLEGYAGKERNPVVGLGVGALLIV